MKNCKALIAGICLAVAAACAGPPTKPVLFAAVPRTPEELAVAYLLDAYVTAWNEHNIEKFVALYDPDAKIDSLIAGSRLSREELRTAMLSQRQFSKVELRKIDVKVPSPGQSHVEAELEGHPVSYDLIERDGQWFIVDVKLL